MSNPTSQAIEKSAETADAMIAHHKSDFATVLPSHIKADQWVRAAQGIVRRDPALLKAARANPGSFMAAMLKCAHLGLEPGDTFYLVPFGNEVTGIVAYTGLVELMFRAGEVVSVVAEVVHENDDFQWVPGQMVKPIHNPPTDLNGKPSWFVDRGDLVGAYAYAEMKSGATSRVVVMGADEIKKHRDAGRGNTGASSPWVKWPRSMYLKTVVKELSKWTPTSPEYRSEVLRQEAAMTTVTESHPDLPPVVDPDDPGRPFDDDIADAEIVED